MLLGYADCPAPVPCQRNATLRWKTACGGHWNQKKGLLLRQLPTPGLQHRFHSQEKQRAATLLAQRSCFASHRGTCALDCSEPLRLMNEKTNGAAAAPKKELTSVVAKSPRGVMDHSKNLR